MLAANAAACRSPEQVCDWPQACSLVYSSAVMHAHHHYIAALQSDYSRHLL